MNTAILALQLFSFQILAQVQLCIFFKLLRLCEELHVIWLYVCKILTGRLFTTMTDVLNIII